MAKWEVCVQEIHWRRESVDADSKEDAIAKVERGEGETITADYGDDGPSSEWIARNTEVDDD